jgi:hypothetical protein
MLTPRSSRTSPCCRPEASTRNDSRRLSAICEKSTFLQYLMEEIAPSGPLEDRRIMLANQVTAHCAWEPAVGWEPLSFGGTSAARSVSSSGSVGMRRRWSAEPAARKLGHSLSFPAVRLRWPGSGRGRRRPPSGNRLRASHRAWRRCGVRSSLFLEVLQFLRELD